MSDKKYIINSSNYTLKRKHQSLSDGTIYERDYMATTNLGGFDSGVFPKEAYNFKMVPADTATIMRNHFYGGEGTRITLVDVENNRTRVSTESRLVATEAHSSFLDFVYYGSCVEFLRCCVENIIFNFPAEFYFTDEVCFEEAGKKWYYISNPFDINIWDTKVQYGSDERVNELRYFALSYSQYMVYDSSGNSKGCIERSLSSNNCFGWCPEVNQDFSYCDGDYSHEIKISQDISGTDNDYNITIRRYYINGKFVLLYKKENEDYKGWYIRPAGALIEEAFKNLGEFERVLLNRDTNPIYTARLDSPYETESGIETHKENFTWPLEVHSILDSRNMGTETNPEFVVTSQTHAYNIDIVGEGFQTYLDRLLKLCNFYDEYFTDNLWRNLTHDAIKNLDQTFIRETSDESKEDIKENVEKVHKFINACGAQFDIIKMYADKIKNVNTITYNNENNLPDYFLTDTLNLSGWEISNSLKSLEVFKRVEKQTEQETITILTPYTVEGLFLGLKNKVYDNVDTNVQFLRNLKLNSQEILSRKGTKYGLEMIFGLFGLEWDIDYRIDEYVVIAKKREELTTGETNVEIYGGLRKAQSEDFGELETSPIENLPVKIIENGDDRCMVPWFRMKNDYGMPYEFDGGVYFQMYGGWNKNSNGTYFETVNYLGIVNTVDNLKFIPISKLHDGAIFYCREEENPEDAYKKYDASTGNWERAEQSEVEKIAAIVDDETGNNPHVGYGHYDDGKAFFDYLDQVFKYSIENDGFTDEAYDCDSDFKEGITGCGFNVEERVKDNVKCWYYNASNLLPGDVYTDESGNSVTEVTINGYDGIYKERSTAKPLDYFKGTRGLTENAAYSVVNTKQMEITFIYPSTFNIGQKEEYKQFINDAVMSYARQIIPSTTIFSVNFRDN